MKIGAWTPCTECRHLPQEPEDRAKHVIASDHYLSQADLEFISSRVKNGEPLHFDPKNVADQIAASKSLKNKRGIGWYVFGCFLMVLVLLAGLIYAIARLLG